MSRGRATDAQLLREGIEEALRLLEPVGGILRAHPVDQVGAVDITAAEDGVGNARQVLVAALERVAHRRGCPRYQADAERTTDVHRRAGA